MATVVAVLERPDEVALDAVHVRDHGGLAEVAPDLGGQIAGGGPGGDVARRTIGKPDRDLVAGHPVDVTERPARLLADSRTSADDRRGASRKSCTDAIGQCRHLGRHLLGLLGRVGVDVVLPGQVADLEHHLVDQLPQHEMVVGAVPVPLDGDGLTEVDRNTP